MASGAVHPNARALTEAPIDPATPTLLGLFSNSLVLRQTLPYLPPSALVSVAATSKAFRDFIRHTPDAFRHLDLSTVKAAQFSGSGSIDRGGEVWRNAQLDENVSENDFYSGPLRGTFNQLQRTHILQNVQTLVLDGLSVTAELVHDILVDPRFQVRILSVRETKNLNHGKLMQSLRYACRATRPEGTPRLQGIYVFGPRDAPAQLPAASSTASTPAPTGAAIGTSWNHKSTQALEQVAAAGPAGDGWYQQRGRMMAKPVGEGWAETLLACRPTLAFDAVLCTGPRHRNSPVHGAPGAPPITGVTECHPWRVATYALGGCASCGSAPEGFTTYGGAADAAGLLPLLAPVLARSSHVRNAVRPEGLGAGAKRQPAEFVPRCQDCVRERYCFACNKWWCEACYQVPSLEELTGHVHIVDNDAAADGLSDHEAAALEAPKPKVRLDGRCNECALISPENGNETMHTTPATT